MNVKSSWSRRTRSRFLNGQCSSFVDAYLELYPEAELKLILERGEPVHIVVEHEGAIVDVTGRWEDHDSYCENLVKEYLALGTPTSNWFEVISVDDFEVRNVTVRGICRELGLIGPNKRAKRRAFDLIEQFS